MFVAVQQLRIDFDDAGVRYAITGHDIDLEIAGDITASEGSSHVIELADDTWLAELAAIADPGDTDANSQNPTLRDAFVDGLDRSVLRDP